MILIERRTEMVKVKFQTNQVLSKFAKLLAGDEITVISANVKTAGMYLDPPTIILPFFSPRVAESTQLHLAAHEVLHFLNPADYQYEIEVNGRKGGILNIIDDCRIEKDGIKRFGGLRVTFDKSYKYIDESGFLDGTGSLVDEEPEEDLLSLLMGELKDKAKSNTEQHVDQGFDTQGESFLQRLNMHLKLNTIGLRQRDIKFEEHEEYAVKLCEDVDTWEDVLVAHDEVLKLHEQEMEEHPERFPNGDPLDSYNSLNASDINSDNIQSMSIEEFIEKLKNGDIDPDKIKSIKREQYSDADRKKANAFNKKNKNKNESEDKFDLLNPFEDDSQPDTYNVDFGTVGKENFFDYKKTMERVGQSYGTTNINDYIQENRKSIKAMYNYFNRRKNARQKVYKKRSSIGKINMNKVVHYHNDERIFHNKKIEEKHKNHGFVMVLDYSGSMDNVLDSLSNQIVRLAEFCHRADIPYRVYIFTSRYYSRGNTTSQHTGVDSLEMADGSYVYEVLNNDCGNRQEAYERFKKIVTGRTEITTGATPVYSTLLLVPRLMASLQNQYKLDKMNLFVFTDGDDNEGLKYNNKTLRKLGVSSILYRDLRATVHEPPKCYFDELEIFYQIYKKMTNVNISTFFMNDYPASYLPEDVKHLCNGGEMVVINEKWGDTFFALSENYLKVPENDEFFVKTLMKNILKS